MTVYNKFDHMISEARELSLRARTRENESIMIDVVLALESGKKQISADLGNSEYTYELVINHKWLAR